VDETMASNRTLTTSTTLEKELLSVLLSELRDFGILDEPELPEIGGLGCAV
jgi:hypothetical protein